MASFYLTTDKVERRFYALTGTNIIVHVELKEEEIKGILEKIVNSPISKIKKYDNNLEIILDDKTKVTMALDSFRSFNDNYENYFKEIKRKVREYQEYEKLKKLKGKNKNKQIKVNRNKNLPKVLTGSLATAAALVVLMSVSKNDTIKREGTFEPEKNIAYSQVDDLAIEKDGVLEENEENKEQNKNLSDSNKMAVMYQEKGEEEKTNTIWVNPLENNINLPALEQNEQVKTTKEENVIKVKVELPIEILDEYERSSRVEATKEFCGDIIEHYATRWGLPVDIVMAQISQERPPIINGVCENVCQLTPPENFIDDYKVPVYDENGFTGTYDEIHLDKEAVYSLEGNIMAGLILDRQTFDKFQSCILGLFTYNQGPNMLHNACKYFGLNEEDYLGEENALKACELIVSYNDNRGKPKYGDRNYLSNVWKYVQFKEDGTYTTNFYIGEQEYELTVVNTLALDYNNTQSR